MKKNSIIAGLLICGMLSGCSGKKTETEKNGTSDEMPATENTASSETSETTETTKTMWEEHNIEIPPEHRFEFDGYTVELLSGTYDGMTLEFQYAIEYTDEPSYKTTEKFEMLCQNFGGYVDTREKSRENGGKRIIREGGGQSNEYSDTVRIRFGDRNENICYDIDLKKPDDAKAYSLKPGTDFPYICEHESLSIKKIDITETGMSIWYSSSASDGGSEEYYKQFDKVKFMKGNEYVPLKEAYPLLNMATEEASYFYGEDSYTFYAFHFRVEEILEMIKKGVKIEK